MTGSVLKMLPGSVTVPPVQDTDLRMTDFTLPKTDTRADTVPVTRRTIEAGFLMLGLVLVTGCMGGGVDVAGAMAVDQTTTSAIPPAVEKNDVADAVTVRNAVSSADVIKTAGNPIPWANTASGSAGVISDISEQQVNGTLCRRFTTTRHSYEGIARFYGNTCQMPNGDWVITSFAPRS